MKNIFNEIKSSISNVIRRMTGEITTDKKFVFTVSLLLIFTILNVYMSYKAIYNKGKIDAKREILNFNHLTIPDLHYNNPKEFIDSEIPDFMPLDSSDRYINNSTYDKQQRKKTAKG